MFLNVELIEQRCESINRVSGSLLPLFTFNRGFCQTIAPQWGCPAEDRIIGCATIPRSPVPVKFTLANDTSARRQNYTGLCPCAAGSRQQAKSR
jgi:hypothetical protein